MINKMNPAAWSEAQRDLSAASVTAVNQRIKEATYTDALIGAVSCLAGIEVYLNHVQEAAMHHSGLVELLRLRGGIKSIDKAIQTKVYRSAILPAVDQLSLPGVPRIQFSVSPLRSALLNRESCEEYTAMLATQGLEQELIDIFSDLHMLSVTLERAIVQRVRISQRGFDEETLNLFHDLLSVDCRRLKHLGTALRYAALIYVSTLTRTQPFPSYFSSKMSRVLAEEVESLGDTTKSNMLVWAVFMGNMAATSTPEQLRFRHMLSAMLESLDIAGWHECQNRLQYVCWIPAVHDEQGQNLWDMVQPL